ncbi:MAG: FtsX-like permease family protein [Acidimicrobiia bacterium]
MSTAVAAVAAGHRAGDGGRPARRAIVRWAWRMFRREWRQQALVLGLLTVAIAATIGFSAAAYNIAPQADNAEFGTATAYFLMREPSPESLQSTLAAAQDWFGEIDAVARREVAVPGSTETVDYRDQDPDGPFSTPMLALRDGRYPVASSEVAVTDGVAEGFGLGLGSSFDLDGTARVVVGIVESPSDLDDEFVLVAPATEASPTTVTILVDAGDERVGSFRAPDYPDRTVSMRGSEPIAVFAAVTVLAVAAIALVLVALVAAASFVVVAQRRLRQLGMLGAIGATERHLRLVMVANGAVLGAAGATFGAVIGLVSWVLLAPSVETAVAHRIDPLAVPWWLIGAGIALAIVAATAAAAWPARAVARIPAVSALSGRPPRPVPVHRSALLAAALVVGGVAALTTAGELAGERAVHWGNVLQVGAGIVAVVLGVLLVCPLAIRVLARAGARLPVTWRLPLRDLARYQARSGAALAAVTLVLGIPVAIAAIAVGARPDAATGNLSDHQLIVRVADVDGPFVPDAADVGGAQTVVDRLVGALDDVAVTSPEVAIDPTTVPMPGFVGREAMTLSEPVEDGWTIVSLLYVATPELLAPYGVELDGAAAEVFTTAESAELALLGPIRQGESREPEDVSDAVRLDAGHSSLPGSFITPDGAAARGWVAVPSGRWLVESVEPFTTEQLRAAREIAAGVSLQIETRDSKEGLTALGNGATGVGIALALGVLVLTVGLIRGEAVGDVRTLTATGATSIARRNLTAATAGGLAVCGVVLGTVGACVALVAGYRNTGDLTPVPVSQLAAIVVGTPIAAAVAGWLFAGREPAMVARQPID